MTYAQADVFIATLQANFPAFMPADQSTASIKRSMWRDELCRHDSDIGAAAVRELIGILTYAPTIAELKAYLKAATANKQKDYKALPGYTESEHDKRYAGYTDNKSRIDEMMTALDRELAGLTDGGRK